MISIELDDQVVQSMLNSLAQRLANMTPVMHDIGNAIAEVTKQRFKSGDDWDGNAWAPNSQVTILRYLGLTKRNFKKRGGLTKLGQKRADAKKPLTGETGELGRSIVFQASRTGVLIGSNVDYAATHQFGAMRGAFGRTKRGGPIPWGNIPPRPFLPIRRDGSMPASAANLVMGILEEYLS